MRAIIGVLIVFIVFFSFSIWTQHYIAARTDEIVQQLDQVESCIQGKDWNSAKVKVTQLKKTWDSTKAKWQMLLDHEELDNIEMALFRVMKWVDVQDDGEALAEMSTLRFFVTHIPHKEALRLDNIL